MQSKFKTAAQMERTKMTALFNQYNVNHFRFTSDEGYDREDGYFTGKTGNEVVFEIKVRNCQSDKYPTTIIEYEKIETLLRTAKETNHKPYLFFFFNNNEFIAQELLQNVSYDWIWLPAPMTTMGNTTLVDKRFVEFLIDDTKIYKIN